MFKSLIRSTQLDLQEIFDSKSVSAVYSDSNSGRPDDGATGFIGATGPLYKGATGATGIHATRGVSGNQGFTGGIGATGVSIGLTGTTGINGNRGQQGEDGDIGPDGAAGKSEVFRTYSSTFKILRGTVNADGTVSLGSGFSCSKNGTGTYVVRFNSVFSTTPTAILVCKYQNGMVNYTPYVDTLLVNTFHLSNGWILMDKGFSFIITGTI
jgi:hypothetical protein